MKYLLEITQALSAEEKRNIERLLEVNQHLGRRYELWQMVVSREVASDTEASMKLYAEKPNSAYSHLKTRLTQFILDTVFPDNHAQADGALAEAKYKCWRNILIGQFFISRDALLTAERTLTEAKRIAEEANLFSEGLIIEDLMLQHFYAFEREAEPEGNRVDIQYYTNKLMNNLEAKRCFRELEHRIELSNIGQEHFPTGIQAILEQIPSLLNDSCSPQTRYWYLRILILQKRVSGDYPAALHYAQELKTLTDSPELLTSANQNMEAGLELSRMQMYCRQFDLCQESLAHILSNCTHDGLIRLQSLEIEFLLHFYQKQFNEARATFNAAMAHPKLGISKTDQFKWDYYLANLEFAQGNNHESLELLRKNTELFKYKSKWLLGYKVLELYNFVCLQEFELLEYKLNALKQLLKRQKSFKVERGKYICKVIATYIRSGYCHEATCEAFPGGMDAFWEPLNYELVSPEMWLEATRGSLSAQLK